MPRIIEAKEVQGSDTVALARWLLGRNLVCAGAASRPPQRVRICETEAYHGPTDRASHASRGRTPRTETMFGSGGTWYVYLCYGVHEMLNLVTGPAGWPAAVLIRGVAGWSGPGRLTRGLGLDRRFNGREATPATGLWLEDDGDVVPDRSIVASPRVGVAYAGVECASKPWRFSYAPTPAQCAGGAGAGAVAGGDAGDGSVAVLGATGVGG